MADSPTGRTMKVVRAAGGIAYVVEKWNAHTMRRIDAWGFGDVLAAYPDDKRVLLIQATSTSNLSKRVAKIKTETADAAEAWLRAGGEIEAWGWRKYAKRVDGKVWRPTVVTITLGDL